MNLFATYVIDTWNTQSVYLIFIIYPYVREMNDKKKGSLHRQVEVYMYTLK